MQSSSTGVKRSGAAWRNEKALAHSKCFYHGIIYILGSGCLSK
uniref:Uncharacterized protein n=1 Tax=Myoviridae sp. ctCdG12 TaxID=2825052 RepID=A0A8S5U2K7_9CAUD|nr:MAG TPA: hypothetical protein [Myoviridae sp. ctCdG12]DAY38627.1 MAG TPA: hypothetical protein [Caudoviricetes sp.]